jgi:5-methylcytosine-specific restriction endonuclease McrA
MSQKRTMPTKAKIVEHWNATYGYYYTEQDCWGCGLNTTALDRAHLFARCKGGPDEEDNLILLCRTCHLSIQEPLSDTIEEANHIKKLILQGLPFFSIQWSFYTEKIKSGIYDKSDLTSIGISKEDIEKFKEVTK